MKEWPYRHQWWVLCATYAVVLYVQRNNLSDPTIATLFLVVGGLLLAWGFGYAKAVAADPHSRRSAAPIAGVIAIVVIGALVVGNWSSPPNYDTQLSTAEAPSSAPVTIAAPYGSEPRPDLPQTPISPGALLGEFIENHFGAYEKYRGRFVQVAGEVAEVAGSPNEGAYLLLNVGSDRENMQARFPKDPGQIKGVKNGYHVVLSCTVTYDGDIESAILNNCSLLK
jgi:hypothetical protein